MVELRCGAAEAAAAPSASQTCDIKSIKFAMPIIMHWRLRLLSMHSLWQDKIIMCNRHLDSLEFVVDHLRPPLLSEVVNHITAT